MARSLEERANSDVGLVRDDLSLFLSFSLPSWHSIAYAVYVVSEFAVILQDIAGLSDERSTS